MSDKEAKLAAARKRAEALKAKKAKQNETEKVDDGVASQESVTQDASKDNGDDADKPEMDESVSANSELEKEIDRLQRLLDESNSQGETLRKNLEEAQNTAKDNEKSLKGRITELEQTLARRDDQVQSFELDISNLKKEHEALEVSHKNTKEENEKLATELTTAKEQVANTDEIDDLRLKLNEAIKARDDSLASNVQTKAALDKAESAVRGLENQVVELQASQSTSAGATETREQDLHAKTETLLSENQTLLSQLSELQAHLISVQDEKFALGESIERLQKEVKEVKSRKTTGKNSSETSRGRVPRDFDRSHTMQEVPLSESATAVTAPTVERRDPKQPPADLQSNIRIDLTSWYDRHAGEAIEV